MVLNGYGIVGVLYAVYSNDSPRVAMATNILDVKKCILDNSKRLKRAPGCPDFTTGAPPMLHATQSLTLA